MTTTLEVLKLEKKIEVLRRAHIQTLGALVRVHAALIEIDKQSPSTDLQLAITGVYEQSLKALNLLDVTEE